jgi:hypothetical protein
MGCSSKAIKGNQEEKLTSIRKAMGRDKSRKISRGTQNAGSVKSLVVNF